MTPTTSRVGSERRKMAGSTITPHQTAGDAFKSASTVQNGCGEGIVPPVAKISLPLGAMERLVRLFWMLIEIRQPWPSL